MHRLQPLPSHICRDWRIYSGTTPNTSLGPRRNASRLSGKAPKPLSHDPRLERKLDRRPRFAEPSEPHRGDLARTLVLFRLSGIFAALTGRSTKTFTRGPTSTFSARPPRSLLLHHLETGKAVVACGIGFIHRDDRGAVAFEFDILDSNSGLCHAPFPSGDRSYAAAEKRKPTLQRICAHFAIVFL